MAWGNDQIRDLVIRTLLGESNHTPEGMTSVAHVMVTLADSGAWGDQHRLTGSRASSPLLSNSRCGTPTTRN